MCSGSNNAARLCIAVMNKSCEPGAGGGSVACGTKMHNPCFYTASMDLPVKCDCLPMTPSTTNEGCFVVNCR